MSELIVNKVLNNNVLIAGHPEFGEVVLIGKGIGFNRKPNEVIEGAQAEKLFVLKDSKEQKNYIKLLPYLEDDLQKVIITAIQLIKEKANAELNEHIHVALTDHLMFTVSRLSQGMEIRNPFLVETKTLFPKSMSWPGKCLGFSGKRSRWNCLRVRLDLSLFIFIVLSPIKKYQRSISIPVS